MDLEETELQLRPHLLRHYDNHLTAYPRQVQNSEQTMISAPTFQPEEQAQPSFPQPPHSAQPNIPAPPGHPNSPYHPPPQPYLPPPQHPIMPLLAQQHPTPSLCNTYKDSQVNNIEGITHQINYHYYGTATTSDGQQESQSDANRVQRWEEMMGSERKTYEEEKEKLMKEMQDERKKWEQEKELISKKYEEELNELRQRLVEASQHEDKQNSDSITAETLQEQQDDNQSLTDSFTPAERPLWESDLREAIQPIQPTNTISTAKILPSDESFKLLQEENRELTLNVLGVALVSIVGRGKVSINSAKKGETVLICWSDHHKNYTIFQEGTILYFLHTDSIETLGLSQGRKLYITAEVVEKAYCQAKKIGKDNRYRLEQGTKFYRVKCKPVEEEPEPLLQLLLQSVCLLVSEGKVSIKSANKWDIVLIYLSDDYKHYAIYHKGPILHFLHKDSIENLGLKRKAGKSGMKYILAEVVEKENCQAGKSEIENRFGLVQGTMFYRVKCKPVDSYWFP